MSAMESKGKPTYPPVWEPIRTVTKRDLELIRAYVLVKRPSITEVNRIRELFAEIGETL
jgi:hypothetical protein